VVIAENNATLWFHLQKFKKVYMKHRQNF